MPDIGDVARSVLEFFVFPVLVGVIIYIFALPWSLKRRIGAGVVALVLAVAGAYTLTKIPKRDSPVRPEVKLAIVKGWFLNMSYSPKATALQFDFDFTLSNEGTSDDSIKDASANFVKQDSPVYIPFDVGNFQCSREGNKTSFPFPLTPGSNYSVSCSVSSPISAADKYALLSEGFRKVEMNLSGEHGSPPALTYCFYINSDMALELSKAKKTFWRQFVRPDCD